MFSHLLLGTNDLEASQRFYDAVLGALGIAPRPKAGAGRQYPLSVGTPRHAADGGASA